MISQRGQREMSKIQWSNCHDRHCMLLFTSKTVFLISHKHAKKSMSEKSPFSQISTQAFRLSPAKFSSVKIRKTNRALKFFI